MLNTSVNKKIKIGISIGDVNGIGLEVILKTLADSRIVDLCIPIIYGSAKVISFHRKTLNIPEINFNIINSPEQANTKKINLINCWEEDVKIEFGQANEIGGKYALISLEKATADLTANKIDAIVTAPIDKHTIQADNFKFPGHTEYFQQRSNTKEVLMLLLSEQLKVGVVTGHIPISKISEKLTTDLILSKIKILNDSLINDFWIEKPKIAVLGLNPHSGDNGLIGKEEQDIIIPALNLAKQQNIFAFGPYPADSFFGSNLHTKFDAVLGMYHDQGLIPFKTLAFKSGVNFTCGLPFIRTSPDHGTGFDIAGKNLAAPDSFREALYMAIDIYRNRKEQNALKENALNTSNIRLKTTKEDSEE